MAKKNDVFATPEKETTKETVARRRAARQLMCERLCANEDFRDWIYALLDDFCAFEFGRNPLDEFTQGIRACADIMQNSLIYGNNGPQFVADLKRKYLEGVRKGLLKNEDN